MTAPNAPLPTLSDSGKTYLQDLLTTLGRSHAAQCLTISNASGPIFDGRAGWFDPLQQNEGDRKAGFDDVLWFASTTKLITSVCYLQLIDRGILSLSTPLAPYSPAFAQATSRVLTGFSSSSSSSSTTSNTSPVPNTSEGPPEGPSEGSQPIFEKNETPVTLGMMLNQTSGFGQEMSPKVRAWKAWTKEGRGWVNSCKIENLIHTPLTEQPGTRWQYGNSAEWLALLLPSILQAHNLLPAEQDVQFATEEYLQENVLKPLGMDNTTYYPFGDKEKRFEGRLMPLRWYNEEKRGYEELVDQCDLLKLPRSREEIEYPAGGGGIYSTTTDYSKLLTHLLKCYQIATRDQSSSSSSPSDYPSDAILSPSSIISLFTPTLPTEKSREDIAASLNSRPMFDPPAPEHVLQPGEYDWSTGMGMFITRPDAKDGEGEGRRRGGLGRRSGSVGWSGAAGTEYWIDPRAGITVVYTTQMLLPFTTPTLHAKRTLEKAIYDVLEGRV